jgi:predicted MFS family arabinose efflux permease
VCIAPVIAELAPEKHRPFLFSVFFSTGIGVGVLGGILGGQLPAIATNLGTAPAYAKPVSLLFGCSLIACGAAMLAKFTLPPAQADERRLYPRNPLLWRFFLVIGMFSLGTGAFNPLYTAFLASVAKLSVERIGSVFALSQLAQVVAISLGGIAVRRFGYQATVMSSFIGTGAALLWLGFGASGFAAAGAYIAYMSFQYMSEPAMFSMLMSVASPGERKGASTVNFLTVNATQAAAAFVAGAAVTRFGYGPAFGVAAVLIFLAACLFPLFVRRAASSMASMTSAS